MKVKSHLVLLVAVVLLPVVLFSAVVLDLLVSKERAAAMRSMHELARATVLAVDQELSLGIATAQTLATSARLAKEDFAGFYRQAKTANAGRQSNTTLIDEDGRQIFNTITAFGTLIAPPNPASEKRTQDVMAGNTARISGLIRGRATGKFVVAVEFPVQTASGNRYSIGQWMFTTRLNELLPSENVPKSWLISVMDKEGVTLARNQRPDDFVGTPVNENLRKILLGPEKSEFRAFNRAGQEMYGVNARSALSGWTVTVGVPVDEIEQGAVRAVSLTALGLLAAILFAVVGATLFIRRLVRAINAVALSAEQLGENRIPSVSNLDVMEMNRLQVALHEAGRRLQATDAERVRHLAEANEARALAESQNKAKDQFLAMLGHELRNPLSAIASGVTLLEHAGSSPETRQRAQQIIARQTGHLNTLVDELLDAHRILNGKIALSRARIDLGATVRQCIDAFEARGATASHKVSAHIESVMVDADPTRLEQMVTNLLDNAVKYTPEGGAVTLAVRRENDHAVFTVKDTGIGMSAELLDHAFEVFVQGPVSSRTKGGLGIGLAVVNALASQHGATLKAESEGTGRGSTFTIRFPVAGGAPASQEAKSGQRINANVSVLVIEDNDDVREMMCQMLSVLGYRVSSADTGQSGLQRAAEERPDVMLVDIDLPDMSGYDIAKRLKSSALTAHIRLIANTGYSQLADKREALASGFDAHLKKPISLDQLVATIENQ